VSSIPHHRSHDTLLSTTARAIDICAYADIPLSINCRKSLQLSNQIRTNPALATTTIPLTNHSYSKLHKAASAIENTTTRLSTH
jgi:hypothetical protein